MRTWFALSSFALAAVVGACQTQRPPAQLSAQDMANVRAVFDSTVPRLRAGNYGAWASEFSEDSRFFPPNAKPVIGRAAIEAWGHTMPPVEQFSFSDVQVSGAGDLAWGTSAYALKLKDLPVDSGKQLVVLHRAAGGAWEVIAGSFNSNMPLPQPAAMPHR